MLRLQFKKNVPHEIRKMHEMWSFQKGNDSDYQETHAKKAHNGLKCTIGQCSHHSGKSQRLADQLFRLSDYVSGRSQYFCGNRPWLWDFVSRYVLTGRFSFSTIWHEWQNPPPLKKIGSCAHAYDDLLFSGDRGCHEQTWLLPHQR